MIYSGWKANKQWTVTYLLKTTIATVETIDFLNEYGIDTSEVESSIVDSVNRCETLEDLECFSKALKESDIKRPRTLIEIGKAFLNKKDYSDAEEALLNAVALDSNDAVAWLDLSMARLNQQNYSGTEEAILRVVTLHPNLAASWHILGVVRTIQENYAGAEEAFLKARDS